MSTRVYKLPAGQYHTHAGKRYLGPCDIEMSDEDYSTLVGVVLESRASVLDVPAEQEEAPIKRFKPFNGDGE